MRVRLLHRVGQLLALPVEPDRHFVPKSNPAFYANGESASCQDSNAMWAVSQAAPMRRVILNATTFLFDHCGGPQYVSGGFFADDSFGRTVINAGQQQFFTRNTNLNGWSNGCWNQVFMGDNGGPAQSLGPGTQQYTTLTTTPVSQEQPFLCRDTTGGGLKVFVRPPARPPSDLTTPRGGARMFAPDRPVLHRGPEHSGVEINAALSRQRGQLR